MKQKYSKITCKLKVDVEYLPLRLFSSSKVDKSLSSSRSLKHFITSDFLDVGRQDWPSPVTSSADNSIMDAPTVSL